MGKIVWQCPSILHYSLSENIKPKLNWLQNYLNLSDDQLSRLVWKFPKIFCYSISDTMEPTLKWFQKRFGLGKEGVSHVFQKQPSLFGCNVTTNLEPTTQFYENCIGSQAAGSLSQSDPRLLMLTVPAWKTGSNRGEKKPLNLVCQLTRECYGEWQNTRRTNGLIVLITRQGKN